MWTRWVHAKTLKRKETAVWQTFRESFEEKHRKYQQQQSQIQKKGRMFTCNERGFISGMSKDLIRFILIQTWGLRTVVFLGTHTFFFYFILFENKRNQSTTQRQHIHAKKQKHVVYNKAQYIRRLRSESIDEWIRQISMLTCRCCLCCQYCSAWLTLQRKKIRKKWRPTFCTVSLLMIELEFKSVAEHNKSPLIKEVTTAVHSLLYIYGYYPSVLCCWHCGQRLHM